MRHSRVTEYIDVFCRYLTHPWVLPCGPAFSCSNSFLMNLSIQLNLERYASSGLRVAVIAGVRNLPDNDGHLVS
jgi:hypothetical protein